MKIALIGYGKMGRAIKRIAHNHDIVVVQNRKITDISIELKKLDPAVVIEFTQAHAAPAHIKLCIDLKIPIVTGTTGWNDRESEIIAYCSANQGALFIASNFSIGAYIFNDVNVKLARIMNLYSNYEVTINEVHHLEKKDAPSGTAITLATNMIDHLNQIDSWVKSDPNEHQMLITSERIKNVKGIHEITYTSAEDSLYFKHEAHNRNGFAKGALLAAEWMIGRKGHYGMSDLMDML